jgi:hypothetical protein
MAGDWHMCWGSVRYPITLTKRGDYICRWCGSTFVGSWRVDAKGRLWIIESGQPSDQSSWRSYAIVLAPVSTTANDAAGTFGGEVEIGAPGVSVHFEKRQAAKKAIVRAGSD